MQDPEDDDLLPFAGETDDELSPVYPGGGWEGGGFEGPGGILPFGGLFDVFDVVTSLFGC